MIIDHNCHIYFKTHFVWKSVGRPKAYNGGICGKKNKVKGELAHAYDTAGSRSLFFSESPLRTEQTKMFCSKENMLLFFISAQNIDCGHSLEPHKRGGSNEC